MWSTDRASWAEQWDGYVARADADDGGVWPAVAAYTVARYSRSGAVVVDPDCGGGIVLVEALRAGRHAVGMVNDAGWWAIARANVSMAKREGAWSDGSVLDGTAEHAVVRQSGLVRRADLVLTAIRRVSPDSDWESELRGRVRGWSELVRPAGYVVLVVQPVRRPDGTLLDVVSTVLDGALCVGLLPVDRCVALLPPDDSGGVGHHAVLVFRAPGLHEDSASAAWPTWESA